MKYAVAFIATFIAAFIIAASQAAFIATVHEHDNNASLNVGVYSNSKWEFFCFKA